MADPPPTPAQQIADLVAPALANGDAAPADIEMPDSAPLPEVRFSFRPKETLPFKVPRLTVFQNPAALQPTVQTAPPTPAPVAQPASSRNSPHPSAPAQAPSQPIPHGSPTRVYLNQNVTPHLLEAMKHLATTEPDKPLKWLSEYLAMKSAEIEG
jgi:COMPASS component SDC1